MHSGIFSHNSFLKRRARPLAISWTLLIFFLCFIPGNEIPDLRVPLADKWAHFILFGVFSFLWLLSFSTPRLNHYIIMFFTAALLGWLVEVLQGLLVALGRSQDNMDTLADALGGLLGVCIYAIMSSLAARKRKDDRHY